MSDIRSVLNVVLLFTAAGHITAGVYAEWRGRDSTPHYVKATMLAVLAHA